MCAYIYIYIYVYIDIYIYMYIYNMYIYNMYIYICKYFVSLKVLECGVGPEPTSEIKAVQQMLASGPRGVTPLCAQIRQVVARVRREVS